MSGASMVPCSQPWSAASNVEGVAPGANAVPTESSGSAQILEEPASLDFHARYVVPLASVKVEGSIEPPSALWHSSGAVELSTNGPRGLVEVATEMHSVAVRATSTA